MTATLSPSPRPELDATMCVLGDWLLEHGVQKITFEREFDEGVHQEFEPELSSCPTWVSETLQELHEYLEAAPALDSDAYNSAEEGGSDGTQAKVEIDLAAGTVHVECTHYFEVPREVECGDVSLPDELKLELQKAGVENVAIDFNGSGDSGNLENFVFAPNESAEVPSDITDALDGVVTEAIPFDWYNNEGGYGSVSIDVTAGIISVNGYARDGDSDKTSRCWKFRE